MRPQKKREESVGPGRSRGKSRTRIKPLAVMHSHASGESCSGLAGGNCPAEMMLGSEQQLSLPDKELHMHTCTYTKCSYKMRESSLSYSVDEAWSTALIPIHRTGVKVLGRHVLMCCSAPAGYKV